MPDLLLVDNDRRIVELAAWFLERRGFVVRTALSFREARVAIRERRPDLMLADLDLGEENGREELPRLATEGLLPKTLVVSGFLDADLDAELRTLDAVVDTLSKPYDMAGLEQRILACLDLPDLPDGTESQDSEPSDNPASPSESAAPEDDDGWVEIVPFRRDAGGEA
jgi:DNA-binding response OmpR family regulator